MARNAWCMRVNSHMEIRAHPTADEGFCGTASIVMSWENRRCEHTVLFSLTQETPALQTASCGSVGWGQRHIRLALGSVAIRYGFIKIGMKVVTFIKTTFIKNHFHQKPLSSKTTFIKINFHQKPFSSKTHFQQKPLS